MINKIKDISIKLHIMRAKKKLKHIKNCGIKLEI